MFLEKLNKVTNQIITQKCPAGKQHDHLLQAIKIWCEELDLNDNETNYIIKKIYDQYNELTKYFEEEWYKKQLDLLCTPIRSKFYKLKVWKDIKGNNENIKFKVFIAFVITAIGYCIYKLDEPKQKQTNRREETTKSSNDPSVTGQNCSYKTSLPPSPNPIITKQFLVLVVSDAQADFLESLQAKRRIDEKDGESLYKFTKYLWLGSKTEYSKIEDNISKYSVAEGAESEYDIYLVSIKLNKDDEGFKPKVNQLDRHDAFRKLADLAVDVTISPRLQMEAYENIGFYSP